MSPGDATGTGSCENMIPPTTQKRTEEFPLPGNKYPERTSWELSLQAALLGEPHARSKRYAAPARSGDYSGPACK
jgi:hypothetical protein